MSEHRTLLAPQSAGVNPSERCDGLKEFDCDCCGERVTYARQDGEDFIGPGREKVGYHDIGCDEDLCPACETKRFDDAG